MNMKTIALLGVGLLLLSRNTGGSSPGNGNISIQSNPTPSTPPTTEVVQPQVDPADIQRQIKALTQGWIKDPTNLSLTSKINDLSARIQSGGYRGQTLNRMQEAHDYYKFQRSQAGSIYSQKILELRSML